MPAFARNKAQSWHQIANSALWPSVQRIDENCLDNWMSLPTDQSAEIAQWDLAAEMIERHGDKVGEIIFALIKATNAEGDMTACDVWIQIGGKIERLLWSARSGTIQ